MPNNSETLTKNRHSEERPVDAQKNPVRSHRLKQTGSFALRAQDDERRVGKSRQQHTGPNVARTWWHIDATSVPLGRIATSAASMLIGKHKTSYVPYIDAGDYVVITGAKDLVLTGRKAENKAYYHHTGYPNGLRTVTAKELIRAGKQADMIKHAVKGMLPHNQLGELMIKRLHIYNAAEHPHTNVELQEINLVEK